MKLCKRCNTTKDLSEFGVNRSRTDGLQYICRQCINIRYRKNNPLVKRRRTPNGNGIDTVYLVNGEGCIVDKGDYDLVSKYVWCLATKDEYAMAWVNSENRSRDGLDGHCKTIRMHRLIMCPPRGMVVDHINGNTLDNRRENLRICTQHRNTMHRTKLNKNNTNGHIGVDILPNKINKYRARICINKKLKHLGCFPTMEEAVSCRQEAEMKYFKEYNPTINKTGGVSLVI